MSPPTFFLYNPPPCVSGTSSARSVMLGCHQHRPGSPRGPAETVLFCSVCDVCSRTDGSGQLFSIRVLLICVVVWMVSMFPGLSIRDPQSFSLSCGGSHEMSPWKRIGENKLLHLSIEQENTMLMKHLLKLLIFQ